MTASRAPGTCCGRDAGTLVGYARILDDGDWARIGRVLVVREARGRGIADELVRTALEIIGDREVRLDAQTGLRGWYASYGFVVTGPEFDEDGVFHVPMARPARSLVSLRRRQRCRISTSRDASSASSAP